MKTYKEIFTEWHNEFPFLKQYSPSTLFQKVGPMLIGLRIEQPWEEIYRVILEAIPLWKTERKDFGNTILYDPLLNKKGGQVLTTFRHVPTLSFATFGLREFISIVAMNFSLSLNGW